MQSVATPEQIQALLRFLERQGYQAYLVGGCVRDMLLGIPPHDWDICTDALPETLLALFPRALTYGMRHGTVTVPWEGLLAEITTFRAEGDYTDHRRPDAVRFITDLKTDLSRRDFTINAIAMDTEGVLHDPFFGQADLRARQIKAVGDAVSRFQEDALRMLRAVRFSAQLDFTIEKSTLRALSACAPRTDALAAERVCAETEKTLLTDHPQRISMLSETGLLRPWGIEGALAGSEKLRRLPKDRFSRWMGVSLLLGDLAPLERLRLDRKTQALCAACVSIRGEPMRDELFWKEAVYHLGREDAERCAAVIARWDDTADRAILDQIAAQGDCCTMRELAIGGTELTEMGLRGKAVGAAMQMALRYVWAHPEENEPERLKEYLKGALTQHG